MRLYYDPDLCCADQPLPAGLYCVRLVGVDEATTSRRPESHFEFEIVAAEHRELIGLRLHQRLPHYDDNVVAEERAQRTLCLLALALKVTTRRQLRNAYQRGIEFAWRFSDAVGRELLLQWPGPSQGVRGGLLEAGIFPLDREGWRDQGISPPATAATMSSDRIFLAAKNDF